MSENEWGEWITHDGEHEPQLGEAFVDAFVWGTWEVAGRRAFDAPLCRVQFWAHQMHSDNWLLGRDDCSLVVRYRIRKPRGLVILETLLTNLPEDVDA